MRMSDFSSDVCSSDRVQQLFDGTAASDAELGRLVEGARHVDVGDGAHLQVGEAGEVLQVLVADHSRAAHADAHAPRARAHRAPSRSEEHPSELQSLMRISYSVFCLKKKKY